MNLPQHIHDASILQHEPLCTHIALYEQCDSRSQSNQVISSFVKAMHHDAQATLASREWAYLAYGNTLPRDKFGVTRDGEDLYTAFFTYHLKLFRGNLKEVQKYQCHVVRNGIGLIGPEDSLPDAQRSMHGRGRKARSEGQRDQHSSRLQRASGRNSLQADTDASHSHKAKLSTLSGTGTSTSKQSKHPTSRNKKKRKASTQKPHVITPSDDSEDEWRPCETREVTIAHRQKRITPNPPCSSLKLCASKDQVSKTISAPRLGIAHGEDTSISQASFSGRRMARRGAGPLLSHGKRNDENHSNVSKRQTRASSRLQKIRSAIDLPTRPRKRLRSSSMSATEGEHEGVSKSTQARFVSAPIFKQPFATASRSSRDNISVDTKARKKRARPEYDTSSISLHENTQVDYCEFLGPDDRPSRPLPRKVRKEGSMPLANEDVTIPDIQCRLPSLRQADQLLRDAASNALALLREGVAPDMPDWTQDKEQGAEDDDLDELDEADDTQSASASTASVAAMKPPVPASPRIWAQSRQEVCESFDHFRAYHSGVYSKDDIVKGYLLGAYAASRDTFHHGGKLIISHGGGKSESILQYRNGRKCYQTDQDQEASDTSVRALLSTWKDRRPLVLLADDKYAHFPYDLASGNYTYVVLGLYWISHAWAEAQSSRDGSGRIVRWKFAFQWCEGQGEPWWAPRQDLEIIPQVPTSSSNSSTSANGPSNLVSAGKNPDMQCEICEERSPFVYEQGWMCLNPRCERFWSIHNEEPNQLDYREEFLRLLPQRFEMLPNIIPTRTGETPGGVTTSFVCSKGWHCVKCGRLSCRFKWEHWECSNCGFKNEVQGRVRSPMEFWNQRPPKEFLYSRIGKDSGILACRLEPIDLGEDKGFSNRLTFILPHDRGKIHLILGTPLSNTDANHIFQLYQQQASSGELKLRRYPLRNHRARGQLLTNYFSQNSGEPYQYVGGTGNTVPFDQAPECIQRALAVIKERASLALHTDIPFNEILSAAYMEQQKMSFHSDSEKGLGPVVASLSLGSAALMHFRLHANVEPKGKSAYALTLVLRHGDLLIMEGDGVQKYYEHTVIPMNFRIAATARCIGSA